MITLRTRHVHRRLALVLEADHLLGGRPLRREELLEPAERRGRRRVLVAQALEQLDAGRPSGAASGESRRSDGGGDLRAVRRRGRAARRRARRPSARAARLAHDLLGEAAQVLDEQDAQADRDRPQLADRQRLDLLVRAHDPAQALRIEAAVGVRDVGPGEAEDPRVAGEMALGQLGELAVVVRRQVVADLAELLVDDVEVVDEPLRGRRDRALVLDRPGQDPVGRPAGRGRSRRRGAGSAWPRRGVSVTACAAARILACCSSRSTLNSSARIGSCSSAWERPRRRSRPSGISTGRVRSHRPQSAHGPTRPTIASSWARVDDTASPRRDGWAPASLGGRAGPIRHMFVSSAGTSGTAGAPLPAVVSTSHRASRV